jgi:hypothetical protein
VGAGSNIRSVAAARQFMQTFFEVARFQIARTALRTK